MRRFFLGALALAAGLCLPAAAQTAPPATRSTGFVGHTFGLAPQLPYTAEYKITRVQTLADGTTITHESTEVVAVDSHGRRMTATTPLPADGDQTPNTCVHVLDPVARTTASWCTASHKATVTTLAAPGAVRQQSCTSSATPGDLRAAVQQNHAERTAVDLGTDTIQGVEAHGTRTTWTTPAGAIGNDAPLTRVDEHWTAVTPGLRGMTVRDLNDNPQTGKSTRELTSFEQSEPDASVFQPPSGYEVTTREGPLPAVCASSSTSTPVKAPDPAQ